MTAAINSIDLNNDDMALLDSLLSDGITDGGEIDLSLESGATSAEDDLLDEMLADTAAPVTAATPAAAAEDASLDLDMDFDGLDLDADEAALVAAALDAEGVDSAAELPEAPAAAPAEPAPEKKAAAPKKPTTARTTYTNAKASEVLKSRLGGDVSNDLVLEVADADLTAEELQAKQAALLDLLNVRPHQSKDGSTQKKVAEKVVMLFSYLKSQGNLNEVLRRTFTVLAKDGYVQMGKTGNLFADLLSKPYSTGTANAQGGQMMQMLPLLRIALPDPTSKGRLVVNPDSVIFMRMVGLLGLDK